MMPIGIRREDKSRWERRVPLTPTAVQRLSDDHDAQIYVQRSLNRVIPDEDYLAAGAVLGDDLEPAELVLGIKEVPPHAIDAAKIYMIFAHVIKGQSHNMPMLERLLEQGCSLIDYERVADASGRRLIFFGWHAGVVAMIEGLWALGQRLSWEGIENPFAALRNTYTYPDLASARAAVRLAGQRILEKGVPPPLAPLLVAVVGYGNVGRGAMEILDDLPVRWIDPTQVPEVASDPAADRHVIFAALFKEQHIVRPRLVGSRFDLQEYYTHPDRYEPCFATYLPHLTTVLHGNYWDARYPRLISKADIAELYAGHGQPRLRVIADASCDVEGGVECTILTTEPDEPVFVYDPRRGAADLGVAGHGPVILAVDILPSELPLEASQYFSQVLEPFVPAIAAADFSSRWPDLSVPDEIRRAVIVYRGDLTPDYRYLLQYLEH